MLRWERDNIWRAVSINMLIQLKKTISLSGGSGLIVASPMKNASLVSKSFLNASQGKRGHTSVHLHAFTTKQFTPHMNWIISDDFWKLIINLDLQYLKRLERSCKCLRTHMMNYFANMLSCSFHCWALPVKLSCIECHSLFISQTTSAYLTSKT